ncbi:MAG: hypothetical protein JW764_06000 [Chlorobiaceae bacterium]|nr:hypothetical protein [Chlorobiaceae bacterium]
MEPENTSPFFSRCRLKATRKELDEGNECARSSPAGKCACSDDSGSCVCDRQAPADFPGRASSAGRSEIE